MLTVVFQSIFGFVVFFKIGLASTWIPIIVTSILTFFVQIGPESFPNLISSELFPNDARSNGKAALRAISSVFSFIVLSLFPVVKEAIGLDMTFFALATTLLLTLIPTFFFLPEAKDVNLNYVSKFYSPVTTMFYEDPMDRPGYGSVSRHQEETSNRVQMIENTFGPGRQSLVQGNRRLLAEGMLGVGEVSKGKLLPKHFFLFNDIFVVASVITPNIINCSQRIYQLKEAVRIVGVESTNSLKISLQGRIDISLATLHHLSSDDQDLLLEADSFEEKVLWLEILQRATNQQEGKSNLPTIQDTLFTERERLRCGEIHLVETLR